MKLEGARDNHHENELFNTAPSYREKLLNFSGKQKNEKQKKKIQEKLMGYPMIKKSEFSKVVQSRHEYCSLELRMILIAGV